jgi:hypothetical protein
MRAADCRVARFGRHLRCERATGERGRHGQSRGRMLGHRHRRGTSFGVKCIVAQRIPNNAASLATIRVTAPEVSSSTRRIRPRCRRPHHGADAGRCRVRVPASGDFRWDARRRNVVPVERAADGRHGPVLSAEAARAQYGVVLTSGFTVDAAATEQCRQTSRSKGGIG